ncbi:MAG: cytochrome-c oxidase, cbb3-type subunit III [Burkholderiales bacterium]
MSDFTHDAWSIYIAVITIVSIAACLVLLFGFASRRVSTNDVGTTGHVWDEDIAERNNPLPSWWMWLFVVTVIFSVVYLVLYPGLGSFAGQYGWSSAGQYKDEQAQAAAAYGPILDKFLKQDVKAVAANPEARQMGQRLFLTYCAQCHGSDAGGSRGFPSLKDRDWLYGGEPDAIRASIMEGRNGMMPPMGAAVGGDEDVRDVMHYVFRLGGRSFDGIRATRGKAKFDTVCAACHTEKGTGNAQIGAPNLVDDIWLHGASDVAIMESITKGRKGAMPAHKGFLDEGKVHLLTAYVYGLSK